MPDIYHVCEKMVFTYEFARIPQNRTPAVFSSLEGRWDGMAFILGMLEDLIEGVIVPGVYGTRGGDSFFVTTRHN